MKVFKAIAKHINDHYGNALRIDGYRLSKAQTEYVRSSGFDGYIKITLDGGKGVNKNDLTICNNHTNDILLKNNMLYKIVRDIVSTSCDVDSIIDYTLDSDHSAVVISSILLDNNNFNSIYILSKETTELVTMLRLIYAEYEGYEIIDTLF